MKPILKFKKVKENVLNFDLIEIISFNYDGKGGALVFNSNKKDKKKWLASYNGVDLDLILFGDSGSCEKFYQKV